MRLGKIFEQGSRLNKTVKGDIGIGQVIDSNWSFLLGSLSKQLFFGGYKNGIVFIETQNMMWATEIERFGPELIQKINGILPKKTVQKVKVRHKKPKISEKKRMLKSIAGKTMSEKIKMRNQEKIAVGEKICKHCNKVYTKDFLCVFCISNKYDSE